MASFLKYLELWLSAAGLLVIAVVPRALVSIVPNLWMSTAITAILVGVLHGMIFWLVRSRQRLVRKQTLAEAQAMLRDLINNKLTTAVVANQLGLPQDMMSTAQEVSQLLDDVSEEKLSLWLKKYPHAETPIPR